MAEVLRYAAFVDGRSPGGNPAGVVPDAAGLTDPEMQAIAADVGYSETAFLLAGSAIGGRAARVADEPSTGARGIRYFSPVAEVPFCGHATIATAVVLAEREGHGRFRFATPVGDVTIDTSEDANGSTRAAFTSVDPRVEPLEGQTLAALLRTLDLSLDDLAADFPPRVSFAGNRHPILVLRGGQAFDGFAFDPVALRALMDAQGWAGTVTVMQRVGEAEWEARNPFPVGRIVEDPATGSAAASFGGYLRALDRVPRGGRLQIRQGRHVGRPSLLDVEVPETGGIVVSGIAAPIA